MDNKNHINPDVDASSDAPVQGISMLILHNDDYHTFDYVIDSLVTICKHDVQQAEQCALLVHYKGKCDVKQGTQNSLRPMKIKLQQKGLDVSIES